MATHLKTTFAVCIAMGLSACGPRSNVSALSSTSASTDEKRLASIQSATASGGTLFGVNLAVAEFGDKYSGTYGSGYAYPTNEELDYFASKGLRLIRLPFLWERVQKQLNGPLDTAELGYIKTFMAAARARNMQVILDIHNYGRYRDQVIGTSAVPNSAFKDLWRRLASEFKDDSALFAYGLMNEPHDMGGKWPAAAQAGMDGVRSVDMKNMVTIAGEGWSGSASWREQNETLNVIDPANNHVYEAHVYFDNDRSGTYDASYDGEAAYADIGVDRLKPFVEWLKAKGKRGFIGEYGVPKNDSRWLTVLDRAVSYMHQNCLSGTYWAAGPWWGDYSLSVEPVNGKDQAQMSVLTKYKENTSCSTGSSAPMPAPTAAPNPMPTATPTPGQAVRSPFKGVPFAVPGLIEAEDFDNGGEGVAFHDSDSANNGGAYRSTSVDIKNSSDTGGGYAVGWGASGEWLEYSINVATSGRYTFEARVASAVSTGAIHMEVDGVNLTGSLKVPNTGAWDSTYASITKSGLQLTAGKHILRVVFDANDVDLNYIRLTLDAVPTPTPAVPAPTPTPSTSVSGTKSMILRNSNLCATISGGSIAEGTIVIQQSCTGSNSQLFDIIPAGGNLFTFRSKQSGKCLDVSGGSTADGASVVQWHCQGSATQKFALKEMGGGYYSVIVSQTGKCIDVNGASTSSGAKLIQFPCHGGTNQQIRFK